MNWLKALDYYRAILGETMETKTREDEIIRSSEKISSERQADSDC